MQDTKTVPVSVWSRNNNIPTCDRSIFLIQAPATSLRSRLQEQRARAKLLSEDRFEPPSATTATLTSYVVINGETPSPREKSPTPSENKAQQDVDARYVRMGCWLRIAMVFSMTMRCKVVSQPHIGTGWQRRPSEMTDGNIIHRFNIKGGFEK